MLALSPEDNIMLMTALLEGAASRAERTDAVRVLVRRLLEARQEAFFRTFTVPRLRDLSLQAAFSLRGYLETLERACVDRRHIVELGLAYREVRNVNAQIDEAREALLVLLPMRPSAPLVSAYVRRVMLDWLEGLCDESEARERISSIADQLTSAHRRSAAFLQHRTSRTRLPAPSESGDRGITTGYEDVLIALKNLSDATTWSDAAAAWPAVMNGVDTLHATCVHVDLLENINRAVERMAPSMRTRGRSAA